VSRYVLELDGEPHDIVRVLRALLRRLGRDHGVRCKSIAPVSSSTVDKVYR
jgi:hypothetical protein